MSACLFSAVWIYGNGLRDARYFDGWVLAGGMGLQLYFHIALKTASLSPKSAMRWRRIHVFLGLLLITAFVSHSDFSLPDTGFEWALWSCFMLVTLSGIFGAYLAWSLKARRDVEIHAGFDSIVTRRAELAEQIHAAVITASSANTAPALPAPPDDAWIMALYTNHLQDFFDGPRNSAAHVIGSRRPLLRITDEIDALSRFAAKHSRDKLAAIRTMVIDKDRLDFARVDLALTKGWLFVHVPITYALIVLSMLHIVVAYSFSSGNW